MSKFIPLALAVCLWLANGLVYQPLEAHPISLSSTIVNIKADRIDVEMEIMLEDLVLYHRLAADGDTRFSPKDLKAAAQKHRQFILDYFSILNADGERLVGEIVTESSETINATGVLQSELMRHSVRYQIVYPLKTPKPTFVTFLQNFGGDKAVLPAVMDLFLLQDGAFVERPTQITYGRPHIMKLNWTKPEAAGRISMADLRKQREEQLRERLGIASYTGLFSFLYVTRFEVRHEVLIPLLTLEQWLPIPRKDNNYLEVDEQAAAREAIEKFFREKNTVTINGQVVEAQLTRLNFFSLDINDFALNAEPRRVNVAQARVGAILTFKSPMTPREVKVKWDAYSEYAQFVQTVVLVDNQPPARHDFHSLEQTYQWSGDLLGAKVEPVKASGSQLPAEQRVGILEQVLSNIYRAFDFREDEQVYDALATSVDGALLRDLYLRIKRTLLMAEQGGALAHVTSVQVSNAQAASSGAKAVGRGAGDQKPGETLEVTWQVTGVAEHWGHVHTRVSEYRAKLSLRAVDGHWKLVGFQLLDEKRIKFETSIRGL